MAGMLIGMRLIMKLQSELFNDEQLIIKNKIWKNHRR